MPDATAPAPVVYASPTKPKETLQALDQYQPLVTYDNLNELRKIKQYAPHAGLALRLRLPNTGSVVELSSRKHRRLLERLGHLLQRLFARQAGARERVTGRPGLTGAGIQFWGRGTHKRCTIQAGRGL